MKGNIHKRLYCEDKFCRRYCCKRHRLNVLRLDKKMESKAWQRFMERESKCDER